MAALDSVFLIVEDEGGHQGSGEASPLAAYNGDTAESALIDLRRVAAQATTLAPGGYREVAAQISEFRSPAAQFAWEMAVVSLWLRQNDLNWSDWLGRRGEEPETFITLPIVEDPSEAERVRRWISELRPRHLKVKLEPQLLPGLRTFLSPLVAELEPHRLILDANASLEPESGEALLHELSGLPVAHIVLEQPFGKYDHEGHRWLTERCPSHVRTMADESLVTVADWVRILATREFHAINVKTMKSGLFETLAILDAARHAGMPCMVGGMVETSESVAVSEALARAFATEYADLDTPLFLDETRTETLADNE